MELIIILLLFTSPVFYLIGVWVFSKFLLRSLFPSQTRNTSAEPLPLQSIKHASHTPRTVHTSFPESSKELPPIPSFAKDHSQNIRLISVVFGFLYVIFVDWS